MSREKIGSDPRRGSCHDPGPTLLFTFRCTLGSPKDSLGSSVSPFYIDEYLTLIFQDSCNSLFSLMQTDFPKPYWMRSIRVPFTLKKFFPVFRTVRFVLLFFIKNNL